jgi:hypothetical protein
MLEGSYFRGSTNVLGPTFFGVQQFWGTHFCGELIFGTQIVLDVRISGGPNMFKGRNIRGVQQFLGGKICFQGSKKFWGSKICLVQKNLWVKIFGGQTNLGFKNSRW